MAEKRKISIPRNLQIGDFIFQIVARPLDDKSVKKTQSKFEYFDVDAIEVEGLKKDPSNLKNILINERISLPADGKLRYADDVFLNEDEAREGILKMYDEELLKAEMALTLAKEERDGLRSARAIFADKPLNKKGYVVEVRTEDNGPVD